MAALTFRVLASENTGRPKTIRAFEAGNGARDPRDGAQDETFIACLMLKERIDRVRTAVMAGGTFGDASAWDQWGDWGEFGDFTDWMK